MVDGFSSADPRLARGPQISAGTYSRLYGNKRRRSRKTPSPSVSINGGTVLINGQGYSVAPELQAEFIRSRTGGVGASAQNAITEAQKRAEIIRNKEAKRLEAAIKRREAEVKKILANQENLKTQKEVALANSKINSYNRLLNAYNRNQENITKYGGTKGDVRVFSLGDPNKVTIIAPNGKRIDINPNGRVVVGKDIAGRRLEFFNGKLVKEVKTDEADTYLNLTNKEINEISSNLPSYTSLVKDKDGKIIGVKDKRDGKTYNVSKIEQYLGEKEQSKFNSKPRIEREFITLARKWRSDNDRTKERLKQANKNKEIQRIQVLNIKKRNNNITSSEKSELNRLLKRTSENYKLGGEFVIKTVLGTLVEAGLATKELIRLIKQNPVETISALPSSIYGGLKADFQRVMSGDPLEIAQTGLEYWALGKATSGVSKGLKKSLKLELELGKRLSPKYFSPIVRKLKLPKVGKTILSAARKAQINKVIREIAKKAKVSKQYDKFIKSVKKGSVGASARIDKIVKLAQSVERRNRRLSTKFAAARKQVIKEFKISQEFVKAQNFAKKLRIKANKGVINLKPSISKNYSQAIKFLDDFAEYFAETKAREAVVQYVKSGGKLTKAQANKFIKSVKTFTKNQLRKDANYQQLIQLNNLTKKLSVKIIRQKKISPARVIAVKVINKIKNLKLTKVIKKILNDIKRGIDKPIKLVKEVRRRVKGSQKTEIRKFRSAVEYNKKLAQAKKIRKATSKRKKGTLINIGNSDYFKAIDALYNFADDLALVRARQIINVLKKSKKKLPRGWDKRVIDATRVQARKNLEAFSAFKKLKDAAKLNEPFAIRLTKVGKIRTAKNYFNNLRTKFRKTKISLNIDTALRKVRDIGRKARPRRIKKAIKNKVREIKGRRIKPTDTKVTIRSRTSVVRRVMTPERIRKISQIKEMNRVVDDLFREVAIRRKVNLSSLKFRQLKNIFKKRFRKAINSNNKAQINKFKDSLKKIVEDLNKKSKQPTIKIIRNKGKARQVKTIKDFKPDTPRGTYQEVRVGNQIQLQEIKTVKTKAPVISKTSYSVRSVQKSGLDFSPLIKATASSFGAPLVRSALDFGSGTKVRTGVIPKLASKVNQDFAQDVKVLQDIGQLSNVNVLQSIAQGVNQDIRSKSKTRTLQKSILEKKKKKKPIRLRLPKKGESKKKNKMIPGYAVIIKKRGKLVALPRSPLRLTDAKDYLAYNIDNTLIRSAWLMPLGNKRTLDSIPSKVKGYFSKVSRKLRPYKIRYGKKRQILNGYIEKTRYTLDTVGEKKQLKLSKTRRKVKKSKSMVKRRMVKRKMTPATRKKLLRNLKKARAARKKKR